MSDATTATEPTVCEICEISASVIRPLPFLHRLKIMALPDPAHPGRRNRMAKLAKLVGDADRNCRANIPSFCKPGLADIAELPGQLQQPNLGADDFLFLGHDRCPFETPRRGAARPDHSAPGLGFRLSHDTRSAG